MMTSSSFVLVADTVCPECAAGKHGNCDGSALDVQTDEVGVCPCPEHEDVVDAEVIEPVMSRKDRARRLLLQAAVIGQMNAQNERARAVAKDEYMPGDREQAESGGVKVGAVRMDEGRVSVRVTDQAAALAWTDANHPQQVDEVIVPTVTDEGFAWLREHHPEWITEVVAHREVFPAFTKSLLDGVKKAKGGWIKRGNPPQLAAWVDPDTGEERTDVPPWIHYSKSDPILNVSPSDEAAEVAQMLLRGALPMLEA